MARRAHFTPRRGAALDIAGGAKMGAYLGAVADVAASEVERRLPHPSILGGITVEGDTERSRRGYEGVVRVKGPGWHLWEFGTKNHGARPAIRPGVQAVLARVGGRWRSR